ncbi:hypothetical protein NIES37_70040 (plasmid) [Tolypothrix tenuis PCC 7101]|uniref:Uncharacterized protein n=1 Tax=Tolypothrix tenuis PCC 7101 TaxID=231146 RepID=A0A1Z4NB98_9CYAN|nr:hypothetical protein [Aulosira sp. FACHB-113]BAZ02991.1 hypothetical protein NIES37_70040 [Tolypothrix tenuis PCC 7101]BAZ78086.1 hypothetical protein NIES50_67190 [Aulosira laxa NIES-50]
MATKTLTKPKQRQNSQNRSWENLTDRRKLRHIENTLDKAIASSIQNDSIQSHEDFKAYVENYSQESGKAPITVELCVGGGDNDEIKGYRFYLTSDPSHRTSGKYLIKNLEGITSKDENYFTPSNIAEICGFAATELDDIDDELEDNLLDLDEQDEEIEAINNELDDLSNDDFNTQIDELDDLGEEDESFISRVKIPPTKTQAKTSAKTQSKPQTKTQANLQDRAKTNNTVAKNTNSREPIDEASRLSATAATNGREVNGVNLAGLAGQLGTLGIAVGQGILEQLAAEADEKRLERILKELQRQNDRVDNIASRLQEAKPDSSESQKSQDSQTVSEKSAADNPLAVAATKIGSKVDNLGSKLDPKYQSQPFELDKNASINEQLNQIEAYLKVLSKRLDSLEMVVSRLEKQIVAQQNNSTVVESETDTDIVPPNSTSQPPTEVDILEHLTKRQVQQQQAACADGLVGFAKVAGELLDQSPQDGIPISNNKTLWVEGQGKQVAITLKNTQGETLFAGTRTQGQWAIAQDNLSRDEKTGICKLPQSKEEYALKASTQALIQKFQEQLPNPFNSNDESTFTWTEKGKVKYEFEVVKLSNGTQLLQGFNPNRNDEQVLDAVLVPGQPPDILQCSIPLREIEAVLDNQQSTRSTQAHTDKDTAKQRQKQTQRKASKPEMQV